MDHIHEFLLVKGVEAVAVHGSKDQEEREWAIDSFKAGKKDVLIATGAGRVREAASVRGGAGGWEGL